MKPKYLLVLFVLVFSLAVIYLQDLKAPWVDECYTYYGIWHDNFKEFYASMLTGINFSPPLYFIINFIIQLIVPTSIEFLRMQSLLWTLIGLTLSYLLVRKTLGITSAILAIVLFVSLSDMLLLQSLEARHYTMFFACGSWVLYMLNSSVNKQGSVKFKVLNFFSHLCLAQVHYLGIIFSGMAGLSFFIYSNNKNLVKRIPGTILCSWLVSIIIYLFLLNYQSAHLNNWPKPNSFSDLLNSYNETFIWLSIVLPIATLSFLSSNSYGNSIPSDNNQGINKLVMTTSILWITIPALFWLLSHVTSVNLFVDRYFIPMQAAVIVLLAFFLRYLSRNTKNKFKNFVYLTTMVFCLFSIGINFKRFSYVLNPEHNYHHKLITKSNEQISNRTVVFKDDPSYFPNAYLSLDCILDIQNDNFLECYKRFSKKIQIK